MVDRRAPKVSLEPNRSPRAGLQAELDESSSSSPGIKPSHKYRQYDDRQHDPQNPFQHVQLSMISLLARSVAGFLEP